MNPDDGVFETMLARDGRVQAAGLHCERLRSSVAELYDRPLPDCLAARVRDAATELIEPHRLRVDATPQAGGIDIAIAATKVPAGPTPTPPVTLRPVVVAGGIGAHKWRDRSLIESLSDERTVPLILDATDEVLEAGAMNVWILDGRRIVTPPVDGRLLPGVTRALLLDLAPTLGLTPRAEPITLARTTAADAIFVTSSIRHATLAALEDGVGPHPDGAAVAVVESIRRALAGAAWDSAHV